MNKLNDIYRLIAKANFQNFIDHGGRAMYQYSVTPDTSNQAKKILSSVVNTDSATKSVDDLLKQIDTIKNGFLPTASSMGDSPTFDKLDYETKTDEQIQSDAENSLIDYKKSSLDTIEKNATDKTNSINKSIALAKENASSDTEKVGTYYKTAKQNASDNAVDRGLARSSIIINQLNAFSQAEIDEYTKIDKTLSSNLNTLNFELDTLNTAKENALNDFDITYAVKLDEKISKIKSDLTDTNNKILQYNNQIQKLEEDYKLKYQSFEQDINNDNWKKEQDLIELAGKYGTNFIQKYKASKIYDTIKDYLSSYSSQEAKNILENSLELKQALGSNYQTLYDSFK